MVGSSRVMLGFYIFSVLTALMLSLVAVILLLYRSMKLLEQIVSLLSRMDERARDMEVAPGMTVAPFNPDPRVLAAVEALSVNVTSAGRGARASSIVRRFLAEGDPLGGTSAEHWKVPRRGYVERDPLAKASRILGEWEARRCRSERRVQIHRCCGHDRLREQSQKNPTRLRLPRTHATVARRRRLDYTHCDQPIIKTNQRGSRRRLLLLPVVRLRGHPANGRHRCAFRGRVFAEFGARTVWSACAVTLCLGSQAIQLAAYIAKFQFDLKPVAIPGFAHEPHLFDQQPLARQQRRSHRIRCGR
jgi:hypothetical protein